MSDSRPAPDIRPPGDAIDGPGHQESLRRWHRGDVDAVKSWTARHADWILGVVRRRLTPDLRGRLQSQDVVQDVMVRALERVPYFELNDENHFRALLARLVANEIVDRQRWLHRKRRDIARERPVPRDSVLCLDPPRDAVARPSQLAQRDERRAWLCLGMEFLGPEQREVLRLHFWEGQTFVEIGERLGVSEDAARMRHNRALKKLGERVAELRRGNVADLIDGADSDDT